MAYDDDKDAVVRFYGAQTEVTVPFGRWVEIGGVADQKHDVIKEILSRGRNDQTTSMSMLLMAERLKWGASPQMEWWNSGMIEANTQVPITFCIHIQL